MSRTRCSRAARILALVYVAAMTAGGFATGALGPSPVDSLLSGLAQPGLNVLYVFVLMPLAALLGDSGEGAGEAAGTALACGLGAAVNVLLLWTVVRFARAVGAELPACRKRRTPLR
ncbi:hypothetical protein [Streptomyces sp. M3]|uniref:hypothetical protein n=1 Tax=Streptomyces sp. M3 TaxID=295102 RepID=UPI00100EF174|nr:hypothetical protein [Streptomyces sp. M3]